MIREIYVEWNLNKTNLKGMEKKFTTEIFAKTRCLIVVNTAYVPLIEVILLMHGNLYYTNLSVSQLDNKSRLEQ